jgi:prepilin-type N-terminal cleavage/methylation domain-containing protein
MTDIACHQVRRRAFTLIELLCVIAIIAVLASLLLGASARVLKRIRADEWGDKSSFQFGLVQEKLRKRFAGREDFPAVTLEQLEAEGVLQPTQVRFLRDKRVAFVPFSGAEPSNFVVVALRIERGFFTDAETRVLTKGEVVAPVP